MDISPVLITLGAALFLGERFCARRAFGVVIALIGAMIIIRLGSGVLSLYILAGIGTSAAMISFATLTSLYARAWSRINPRGPLEALMRKITEGHTE